MTLGSAAAVDADLAGYRLLVSAGPEAIGSRGERFRAVVIPILALYAARGLAQLGSRVRSRLRGGAVASIAPGFLRSLCFFIYWFSR